MHYYAVNFVFNVSFRRGSKRMKNIQKKKGHFERSSLFCFRPFPETTFLERPRCRGAVLSSKKEKKERKKGEKKEKTNFFGIPRLIWDIGSLYLSSKSVKRTIWFVLLT